MITMKKTIQKKLLEINRHFYDRYSSSFSATRSRVQPGVRKILGQIAKMDRVLDVGCGNGTLARALATTGFTGEYVGVDMSSELISRAEFLLGNPQEGTYHFQQVDLEDNGWHETLSGRPYDWLVSFAVLHHLPGEDLRSQTAAAFAKLVSQQSHVAISVWQWHHSERLRKRVQPWSLVGVLPEDVEKGDVLLDWRAGKILGLRYVHTFSEDSLQSLAEAAGFKVIKSFYSDGKTGDLALYQTWGLAV
jgi:2-polyprenyl-3-methyl-5-hydroxy-6-metoxy-1,4-benzoquinol methylase